MTIVQYNPGDDKTYAMEPNGAGGYTRQKGYYFFTHPKSECEGRPCCLHSPSIHPLMTAPLNWREDRRIMERICPHGVGHTDPDDVAYQRSIGGDSGIHGCDGCCHE